MGLTSVCMVCKVIIWRFTSAYLLNHLPRCRKTSSYYTLVEYTQIYGKASADSGKLCLHFESLLMKFQSRQSWYGFAKLLKWIINCPLWSKITPRYCFSRPTEDWLNYQDLSTILVCNQWSLWRFTFSDAKWFITSGSTKGKNESCTQTRIHIRNLVVHWLICPPPTPQGSK